MMYFAVHQLGADGGMQITGSHNPPDYNGFKMMLGTKPFYGDQIQELGLIAAAGDFARGAGRPTPVDVFDRLYQPPGRRTITAPGRSRWSGTPATARPARRWRRLPPGCPAGTSCLFAEVDGNFPNHHPDPDRAAQSGRPDPRP